MVFMDLDYQISAAVVSLAVSLVVSRVYGVYGDAYGGVVSVPAIYNKLINIVNDIVYPGIYYFL